MEEEQSRREKKEERAHPDAAEVRLVPPTAFAYPRTQLLLLGVIAIELALQLLGLGK